MATEPATTETIARLHNETTLLHAFIYFASEAAEEYATLGITGRSGYFASRCAAMGPLPTEMIVATFYNFSPDLVLPTMDGVWDTVSAPQMQTARWRAAQRVLNQHVRPVLSDEAIAEAVEIVSASVAGLSWSGRPMAAGNAAQLAELAASSFSDDQLLKLWQLVTIQREWRGDAHIGLLVAEPLDGAECTVVSDAMFKVRGAVKTSRAWSDADWDAAVARLTERHWLDADGAITGKGRAARAAIETRTNELAAPLWAGMSNESVNRLGDLLEPAGKALVNANYFAAIGRPAPKQD